MAKSGTIRVGIGGWTYDPWRQTFYPDDLPKKSELHYASRAVTAIEINGTFYRLQTPEVFCKWRDETPADFVFSIKAPRQIVQRRNLAESAESLKRFLGSGLAELGDKLGPILWQLAPTKKFDADEMQQFFLLLPPDLQGVSLRHAIEVRHPSFVCEHFINLARRHKIAIVYTHSTEYPGISDVTGDFVYARLRQSISAEPTGYPKPELERWKTRALMWATAGQVEGLPKTVTSATSHEQRDVFIYFINGAKERAPAAAQHLISLLR
jgi:uncharacterized protein YecE (DUF72 family)